ncbi:hypothetical protein AYL99_11788 [Fonsecaea erecta]|uniref:Uncharacterized protein n=1 Tax=Fonsecaea erecta TaxID=1367422 RepID=A0A178Z2J1_9EURO|nr:hypothetical protein AYL99_11788 [Fonsecaea erecta]OAP54028.1 hypothetical protein AYL99_11788 [Fonsecaea erecta]
MESLALSDICSEPSSTFSSPKKRNRGDLSSSSEEYVFDKNVGDRIKGRVPGSPIHSSEGLDIETYRVGGPELPMLPIRHLETPKDTKKLFGDHIGNDLAQILKEYSLWPTNPFFDMITLLSLARPDAEPHTYVWTELQWYDGCQQLWTQAADKMRSKLKQLGHPEIRVLLADPRAMITPFSKAIPIRDPLLKTWPSVADKILKAVSVRQSWLTLDLLIRGKEWYGGKDEEKFKAVLLIHFDTQDDWEGSFLQEARSAISSDPVYQQRGVELEILRGYLVGGANRTFDTDQPPAVGHGDDLFNTIPYMGASICPDSYVGSGSFGCAITLGDSATYGLTACHVALPTSDGQVTYADPTAQRNIPPGLVKLLPTGAAFGKIPNPPVIKMPSKSDLEAVKKYHQDEIDAMNEIVTRELKYVEDLIKAEEPGEEPLISGQQRDKYERYMREIVGHKSLLSKANKLLADIDSSRCSLGPIRAFSGFRKDENTGMILDWALFPMHSSKGPIQNRLPSQPPHPKDPKRLMEEHLLGFSAPLGGETVYKVGRTTGFTTGIVNPAPTFIHKLEAPSTRVWPGEPGSQNPQSPELSRASVVGVIPINVDGKFLGPGDPGAVVFDADGIMKGLIVAGCYHHRVAYITPSPDLLKDIKMMTGAKEIAFPNPRYPSNRPMGSQMLITTSDSVQG